MRIAALTIVTIATLVSATPAPAQTYDPSYPVCLQTYGIDGNYIQCSFNTLEQCQMTAMGRAAQCIVNPYFGGASAPRGRRPRGY